ncbi:hypothetical protein A3K72_01595 [Candidatus Woesearchaeota archaeon RBG_13_36_6]|nr:MAG: hypothetical protein A3K72_01595 [Candidatus Woesearchaeota archaeon RBG_13_36_6]
MRHKLKVLIPLIYSCICFLIAANIELNNVRFIPAFIVITGFEAYALAIYVGLKKIYGGRKWKKNNLK